MAQIDQQFVKMMDGIAKAWGLELLQKMIANVQRQKLTTTKQLLSSLSQETRSQFEQAITTIAFGFEEYGRYFDMKSNRWSKQPPIEDIIKWVTERGVGSFGADPSPNKIKAKSTQRRINEIAWGISRKRLRNHKWKQRPWFQSTFYKAINALQEELLLGFQDRTIEAIKESLSGRLQRGGTTGTFI